MKKIYYGKAVYNSKEILAVTKVLKNKSLSLMDGNLVKVFEKKICNLFGKKFGLMVNSGSSANLLALKSLNLIKGSEVITPLLTFSTTVSPIIQLGLIPKFVDVGKNTYVADTLQIEKAITKKTSAIMLPNLLGNVPDWFGIKELIRNKNIKLIEDSADTIGYSIKKKNTGKITDIVTTSFYASHVITGAGFGGMICFNNSDQLKKARLLRGWGRSSSIFNESEDIKKRFKTKLGKIEYDSKYIFSDFGYNFIPSEISAAFAIEQLKKLKLNIKKRIDNFNYITKNLKKNLENYLNFPVVKNNLQTAWLAYPLTIKKNSEFKRKNLQIYLEKNNIQTRTIFTGNILRQPMMKNIKHKKLPNIGSVADHVMKSGILIGCHHGMKKSELKYMCKKIINFFKKN